LVNLGREVKIGVLGGGQLARMLALAAAPLGIELKVLSESADDPAAKVSRGWRQGNPKNLNDVRRFVSGLDVVTFESEFATSDVLDDLGAQAAYVFPSVSCMKQIQNRASQKKWLQLGRVPTLPHVEFETPIDKDHEDQKLFKFPQVLKTQLGGYDGYGTFVIKSKSDWSKLKLPSGSQVIVEPFCSFNRELAITYVRSISGEIRNYPLVQTHQKNNRCDYVVGPVVSPHFKKLDLKLRRLLKTSDYVGAITFELFETKSELLVNEVAPRVHNSAHLTMDAFNYSQFEMHLLSFLKVTLPQISPRWPRFGMLNLLGEVDLNLARSLSAKYGAKLHWYGKEKATVGRKMGHMNFPIHTDRDLRVLLKIRKELNE
jgi:5-(carboxyamino)imidazole ribonucleotide synthase